MLALRVEQKINYAVFILCIAAAFGLFFSRAVLSIATVGLSLAGIVHLISAPKKWLSNSLLLVLLAFVGWLALSFFYTPSALIKNYFQEVSFKFSVFGIFAGVFTAQLSQRQKAVILLCFSGFASLVALGTLYNYLTHYQEINELISKSKPIPVITGYFHISFSLMLGFSVLAMLWLLLFNRDSLGQFRWFMILSGSINFILIHVIAARTGLVSLYVSLAATGFLYFIIERRKVWQSFALLAFLALFAVLSIAYVKPLHNRYENTMKDLHVYLNGENANWWSGAMRLHSIENSWYIFKEHPVFGVGMANLPDEVQRMYVERKTLLLPENRINPHNQFINLMAAAGFPGLILLTLILYFALNNGIKSRQWLLIAAVVMFFVGFNLESFLERQFGSCFFGMALGLLFKGNFSEK